MKTRGLVIIAGVALALGACQSKKKKSEPAEREASKPPPRSDDVKNPPPRKPVKAATLDPAALEWKRFDFEKGGVSFDVLAGARVQSSTLGAAFYARQMRPPIQLAVWAGQGRTLENWRKGVANRKGFVLGEPQKVRVCGVDAVKQELQIPERKLPTGFRQVPPAKQGAAPSETRRTPTFKIRPPRIGIALGFELRGVPIIASWGIEADKRAAFRAAEDRFFASIRCPSK